MRGKALGFLKKVKKLEARLDKETKGLFVHPGDQKSIL